MAENPIVPQLDLPAPQAQLDLPAPQAQLDLPAPQVPDAFRDWGLSTLVTANMEGWHEIAAPAPQAPGDTPQAQQGAMIPQPAPEAPTLPTEPAANTDPTFSNLRKAHYILDRMDRGPEIGKGFFDAPGMREDWPERVKWAQDVLTRAQELEGWEALSASAKEAAGIIAAWSMGTVHSPKEMFIAAGEYLLIRGMSSYIGTGVATFTSPFLTPFGGAVLGGAVSGALSVGSAEAVLSKFMRYSKYAQRMREAGLTPLSEQEYAERAIMVGALTGGVLGAAGEAIKPLIDRLKSRIARRATTFVSLPEEAGVALEMIPGPPPVPSLAAPDPDELTRQLKKTSPGVSPAAHAPAPGDQVPAEDAAAEPPLAPSEPLKEVTELGESIPELAAKDDAPAAEIDAPAAEIDAPAAEIDAPAAEIPDTKIDLPKNIPGVLKQQAQVLEQTSTKISAQAENVMAKLAALPTPEELAAAVPVVKKPEPEPKAPPQEPQKPLTKKEKLAEEREKRKALKKEKAAEKERMKKLVAKFRKERVRIAKKAKKLKAQAAQLRFLAAHNKKIAQAHTRRGVPIPQARAAEESALFALVRIQKDVEALEVMLEASITEAEFLQQAIYEQKGAVAKIPMARTLAEARVMKHQARLKALQLNLESAILRHKVAERQAARRIAKLDDLLEKEKELKKQLSSIEAELKGAEGDQADALEQKKAKLQESIARKDEQITQVKKQIAKDPGRIARAKTKMQVLADVATRAQESLKKAQSILRSEPMFPQIELPETLPHDVSDVIVKNKGVLAILNSLNVSQETMSADELAELREKLFSAANRAMVGERVEERTKATDFVDSILQKMEELGRQRAVSPVVQLKQNIENIQKLVASYKAFYAELQAIPFEPISIDKVESLRNQAFHLGQNLNYLEELDVMGFNFSEEMREFLSSLDDAHRQLDAYYRALRLMPPAPEKVTVSPPAQLIEPKQFDDMYDVEQFFIVTEDVNGDPRFEKGNPVAPITSEEEVGEVFLELLEKRLDQGEDQENIEWLYNKVAGVDQRTWAKQTQHTNTFLRGITNQEVAAINRAFNPPAGKLRKKAIKEKAKVFDFLENLLYDVVERDGSPLIPISSKVLTPAELESLISAVTRLGRNFQNVARNIVEDERRLGRPMARLKGRGWVPQSHDPDAISSAGVDTWSKDITDMLDWDNMRVSEKISKAGKKQALAEAFANIISTSDGRYVGTKTGGERFFVFKDYKSWKAYQNKYGRKDSLLNAIGGYITSASRRQATVQAFGHNPKEAATLINEYFGTLQKLPKGTRKQVRMIQNGMVYLTENMHTSLDPSILDKIFDSGNALAIPMMLKDVARFALMLEPTQAAMFSKELGINDSALLEALRQVKDVFVEDIAKRGGRAVLAKMKLRDALEIVYGGDKELVEQHIDMLAIHDMEQGLRMSTSPSNRKDVYPWAAKWGGRVTKLSGADKLLELGRNRNRFAINRWMHRAEKWSKLTRAMRSMLDKLNLTEGDWELFHAEIKELGTIKTKPHAQEMDIDAHLFNPLKAIEKIREMPTTLKTRKLLSVAEKLERLTLEFVNKANLQGSDVVKAMFRPPRKRAPGRTFAVTLAEQADKAVQLFMGWPRALIHHLYYEPGGGWGKLAKYIAYMAIPGVLTVVLYTYLHGKDPFADWQTTAKTILKGVTLMTGTWVETFLSPIIDMFFKEGMGGSEFVDKFRPDNLWKMAAGSPIPAGVSMFGTAAWRGVSALSHVIQGDYAKAMHAIRKMIPFNHWAPTDIIINRVIMDSMFYMLDSSEALDEIEMEINDAERLGETYLIEPDAFREWFDEWLD